MKQKTLFYLLPVFLSVFLALVALFVKPAILNAQGPSPIIQEFQSIPTNSAVNWEYFTIGSDSYLAVANQYNGSTRNIDSKIYRWNGTNFVEFQSIPTNGARDLMYFTIGSDSYLAVTNQYDGTSYNLNSKIYRWNGTNFVEFQSIPTSGAWDWEYFAIDGDSYLAVGNNYNGATWNLGSKIYRWNGTNFVEFQSIPTNGGIDWEHFTIGNDTYLAIANHYNDGNYNIDSKIYRWNGTNFVEFQSIPTNSGSDWEHFTIGSDIYLAVANAYNGTDWNMDSKIYRWNGTNFIEFQSIPTIGAIDWEYFTFGSDSYLAVANQYNGSTFNLDSKIYRWNGTNFVEFQSIPISGGSDWEHFTIGSDTYLAAAHYFNDSTYNIDSKVYKLVLPNQLPTVDAGGIYNGDEGSAIALNNASASDPENDPLTFSWSVNSPLCTFSDATILNADLTCDDNGSYIATLTASDGVNEPVSVPAEVTVNNIAPTVGAITAPLDPVPVNSEINTNANFTDPGMLDTHTAVWDWGDGSTSAGTVNETNGSGSVSGNHTYTTPGVYTVKVVVTDKDGDSGEAVFQFVVVYDPDGGFVTGGGWIDSPEGAYTLDPSLTGKATFGFVSKYKNGANVPTGQTEFQFKAGNLNFHSSDYDWLVVAGPKAMFKGVGTINGSGNYGFIVGAIDEKLTPSTDFDLFRIKIWDKDNGDTVVYDNQMGVDDDADPTTAIGGGSIVIHNK